MSPFPIHAKASLCSLPIVFAEATHEPDVYLNGVRKSSGHVLFWFARLPSPSLYFIRMQCAMLSNRVSSCCVWKLLLCPLEEEDRLDKTHQCTRTFIELHAAWRWHAFSRSLTFRLISLVLQLQISHVCEPFNVPCHYFWILRQKALCELRFSFSDLCCCFSKVALKFVLGYFLTRNI